MTRKNYNGWMFLNDNMAWIAIIALFGFLMIPATCNGQDPGNWRRLYSPDMVCMPLDDFHVIAAKRAVADQLSRERAWVLLQQEKAIAGLRKQADLCDEQIRDMEQVIDLVSADRQQAIDANQELQVKLAKARQWSTIGKVGVALVGIVTVGAVVNQFAP